MRCRGVAAPGSPVGQGCCPLEDAGQQPLAGAALRGLPVVGVRGGVGGAIRGTGRAGEDRRSTPCARRALAACESPISRRRPNFAVEWVPQTESGPRAERPARTAYKAGVRRVSRRPINQSDAVSSTRISFGHRAHGRADGLWQHASEDDGGRASPERRLNEERCARCGGNPKSPEQPLLDLFRDEAKPGENPLLLHAWPRVFLEDGVLQVTPNRPTDFGKSGNFGKPGRRICATLE